MRRIAQQHPAGAAPARGLTDPQRPGRARRHRLEPAGSAAGGLLQPCGEFGVGQRHHLLGLVLRQRPDQAVAVAGLRPVEGQQRQDVRMAEPLPRHAVVRPVAEQPRRHAQVAVGEGLEAGAQRLAGGGVAALADGGQRRRRGLRQPLHMRREAQRLAEHLLERGGVDDPGQFGHALLPGAEFQRAAVIAADLHVAHRGARVLGQRVPDPQLAQQRHRAGIERIGAHIGRRIAPGRGGQQADLQALARQRQRQAGADRAAAADQHIERRGGGVSGAGRTGGEGGHEHDGARL